MGVVTLTFMGEYARVHQIWAPFRARELTRETEPSWYAEAAVR